MIFTTQYSLTAELMTRLALVIGQENVVVQR